MGFHAILRQILNYCFDAITLRKLYVCATFYAFSNCAACTTFETIYALRQKEKSKAMKASPFIILLDFRWVCACILGMLRAAFFASGRGGGAGQGGAGQRTIF